MLESWKYVKQIPLRTLKLMEIRKEERLEIKELKEHIGYEKEGTKWLLSLGRHGRGIKIQLSTEFQGDESTIEKRHKIEQMVQELKEVMKYIKNQFWNALLFAISKLSKVNQQQNSKNACSYEYVYEAPEIKALAEYVAIDIFGNGKSLSVEGLLELKERIKQVVETDEFKKIQDFSSFGKQIYEKKNA
jgi:hypothetical protein